jgi:curved DNA-binding protein CbpA
MTITDYFNLLDLSTGSSVDEIKKAYRKKARLYHPDINPGPDAKDKFITITEAYDFLISNYEKISHTNEEYDQALEDWRKYRQDRSRKRATAYARSSYSNFRNTRFYKTTRIFDKTTLYFSFAISIMVMSYTIFGYAYRLKHPIPGLENPSIFTFLMLLSLGIVFFIVSFIYLIAFRETSKKRKSNV